MLQQLLDRLAQLADIGERAIHRGEANIGDFVQLAQPRHNQVADRRGGDLALVARAREMREELARRRTVRHFSDRPVPREVIEEAIRAAGTAPNGANRQPWHFVAVADPAIKAQLRKSAELEEREFYQTAPREWLDALAPLGTDEDKPFLEVAPWVIAIFAERWGVDAKGNRVSNYYVAESVGIAAGLLLTTLHHAGLATLTLIEEIQDLSPEILQAAYRQAREWLANSQSPDIKLRLADVAARVVASIHTELSTDEATEILLTEPGGLRAQLEKHERVVIKRALDEVGGRVTHAASLLDMRYQSLAYIIERRHPDLLKKRTPIRRRQARKKK